MTRQLWRYARGNRRAVVLYFLLFVAANAIVLLEPLLVAKILNTIQQAGVTQENLWQILGFLALFIVIEIGFWAFHGPARVIELQNAFFVRAQYKKFLLNGVMNLPASWHSDHHSGDTIDRVEKGTKAIFNYAEGTFEVIESLVRFTGAYIALVYFNVHSSYIVGVMVVLTIWMILRFDRVLEGQYAKLNRFDNRVSAKIYDTISNITTVIILRIERLVSNAIYKKIMAPLKLYKRSIRINEVKWFLVTMCGALMVFMVIGSYVWLTLLAGGVVLFGTVYLLYGYLQSIRDLFFRFAYLYGNIVRHKADVSNSEALTDEFPDDVESERGHLDNTWKKIEVLDLNFSYHGPDNDDLHLENVSFSFLRGENIAFIGESGSGKTTALKVMRGLYEPQSICVLVDGLELENGFKSMSADIALIPQDPEIFNASIRDNITVGVPHTDDEIQAVTDMARFSSVVEQLPKGLSSSIVEKGVNLSGGEKQRLALARGLMASVDKSILLLDEPTSSVDPKNELAVYESMFEAFPNTTIISAIHRLHLLPKFDRIVMFDDASIVGSGSFDDLLKNSVQFRKTWERYERTVNRQPEA